MKGGTKSFQKNANISLVLRSIRQNGRISRIEIARNLGLNRSTITYIVAHLLDQGIIRAEAEGYAAAGGGRKPIFLGLNPEYGCTLGLEMQYLKGHAVLTDLVGSVLYREVVEYGEGTTTFKDKFTYIYERMQDKIRRLGLPLLGVGIGLPGLVDPFAGKIIKSTFHKLEGYDFAQEVQAGIPVPVLIDNDANCCALAEMTAHREEGIKDLIYLLPKFNTEEKEYRKVGVVGMGIGIIADGKVYYGHDYSAGELRSVFWERGLHEQVGIPSEELLRIDRDPSVLRRLIRELCFNLSVIISLLNPGRIYVGGDLCSHFATFMDVLDTEMKTRFVSVPRNRRKFFPTDYDEFDVAAGAATMFLEHLFNLPELKRLDTYYTIDWNSIFMRSHPELAESVS
ncbi:MAG: ROK family transcriptional regulator [Spirochaetia bacterium]